MDPPPYTSDNLDTRFRGLNVGAEPAGDRLIIALDFGTTYSGIAYAFTNDPEKVYTVDSWPGGDRIVPKTPTSLKYDPGSQSKFKWGYELERETGEKIERMKLLFDPDQERPYFININLEAETAKLPKPVVDVASDYIRAAFQHAIKEIERNYLDPEFLNNFEKQYILTVPAVWSDKAKDMTLRAARNAGISPVEMITEPEAAALFTLQTVKNRGLKVKDAILVCDAGGGTVDLISYEIVSLDPFELKALTKPSGGIAGSTMINRLLEEEIQKVVGDEAYVKLKKTDGYRNALREFDVAIKVSFAGKSDPDKYISFPMANLKDNPAKGLIKNSMTLSGQAVFLVGGFGSSGYMRDVIQKSNPGVMVLQPKEAWSSIVRGAVMSKLPLAPSVVASKAIKHYGTCCSSQWDSIRDRGFPKYNDEWMGPNRCDIMKWFIYMDDELERGKVIKLPVYFTRYFAGHNPTGDVLKVTDPLYESKALLAPDHPEDGIVTVNCNLETDLNQVPKSLFTKKYRDKDGAPYCTLSYRLQVESTKSGLMKYSLEVEGKEYSAMEASY